MSSRITGLVFGVISLGLSLNANSAPQINLGDIPAGKEVTITYDVTVNNNATGNNMSSQATISGSNFVTKVTDDPDTAAVDDATVTDIDPADTSLGLVASTSTAVVGESVTFTAMVTADDINIATPVGDVAFSVNGTLVTTVPLNGSGEAAFNTTLVVGGSNVTADYLGNTEYAPSSNSSSVTTSPADTNTVINSANPAPTNSGEAVTVSFNTSIVAPGMGTLAGTVTVSDGVDSCNAAVAVGSCIINITTVGSRSLVATFVSSDPNFNGSSSAGFSHTVNNTAPTANPDVYNVDEDSANNLLAVLANDVETDPNQTITITSITTPSNGGTAVISGNNISYSPAANYNGVETFSYSISDGAGGVDSTTVTVTVVAQPDPPQVDTPIADQVATQDVAYSLNVSSNFSDPDNDPLQFSATGLPTSLAISTSGLISGTPNNADALVGSFNVTVTATDGALSVNDVFVLTVTNVNDQPVVVTPIGAQAATEDVAYYLNVAGNFSDPDNDSLIFSAVGLPASLSISSAGLITGSPTNDEASVGSYNVMVTASDGALSVVDSFVLTVNNVNDAPVITPILDQSVDEQFLLSFTAEATDVDQGDSFSFTLGAGAPTGATIQPGGLFEWTPTEEQGGQNYDIRIVVTDLAGASDSSTFTVTVNEIDNNPVLQDDLVITDEDVAVSFDPFINDEDDLGFDYASITIVQQPTSGLLEVDANTGEMIYRPNLNFNGSDQAQYQVKDTGGNDSNIGTIQFTINAVNDAPIIESQPELTAIETVAYSYLIVATDVENEPLQITTPTLPAWLQQVGNELTGTPQLADIGDHPVVIHVDDGNEISEQTFVMNVRPFISGDLSVVQVSSSHSSLLGESFTINYQISNSGPTEANSSILDIELTGDVSIVDMDASCSGTVPTISCNLATVELDETREIVLTLSGNSINDLYSFAEVASPDDPTNDNNQSAIALSITETLLTDVAANVGETASRLVVTGDINKDGLDDVILLPGTNSIGSVFLNQGQNAFNKTSDIAGTEEAIAAALADINADTDLDLVIATKAGQATLVYHGDGAGNFVLAQTLTIANSHQVMTADINGDDLIDLVMANDGANDVYINNGVSLKLSHQFGNENSVALELADIDGDTLIDAVFANSDGNSLFYTNSQLLDSSANNFSSYATGLVKDITPIDLDGDGASELIFALGIDPDNLSETPQNKVYGWSSGLSLLESFGRVDSQQIIVEDIDGDSDQDVFVANSSGAHQIYLNDSASLNITSSLLVNEQAVHAAWMFAEGNLPNLILAEALEEASALYINQGAGNFGVGVADLALNYSISSNFANKGDTITITYNITNLGPGLSDEVKLDVTSGNEIQVITSSIDVGTCSNSNNSMSCELGLLFTGDSINISMQVKGIKRGRTSLNAMVTAITPDLVSANNSANFVIQINDLSGGGGATSWWLILMLWMMVRLRRRHF